LKKLAKAFGDLDGFAMAVELETRRVDEMLQGKAPISSEMAMHLEDSLNLPGGWMENTDSKYAKIDARRAVEQKAHPGSPELHEPDPAQAPTRGAPPPPAIAEITTITGTPQKIAVSKTGAPVKVITKPHRKPHRVATSPVAEAPSVAPSATVEPPAAPKVWPAKPGVKAKPSAVKAPAARPQVPPAEKAATSTPKTAATPSPGKEMQQNIRRMNLALLTEKKGEKARMSRVLGIHASQLSLKLAGSRVMSDKFCKKIELAYGLTEGWMSEARLALPAALVPLKDFVQAAPMPVPAVAAPAPAVAAPAPPMPMPVPVPAVPVQAVAAQAVAAHAAGQPSALARALSEVILYRASTGALDDTKVTELLSKLMQEA
jgi:plasmid maintenance system antidote protein VapI